MFPHPTAITVGPTGYLFMINREPKDGIVLYCIVARFSLTFKGPNPENFSLRGRGPVWQGASKRPKNNRLLDQSQIARRRADVRESRFLCGFLDSLCRMDKKTHSFNR